MKRILLAFILVLAGINSAWAKSQYYEVIDDGNRYNWYFIHNERPNNIKGIPYGAVWTLDKGAAIAFQNYPDVYLAPTNGDVGRYLGLVTDEFDTQLLALDVSGNLVLLDKKGLKPTTRQAYIAFNQKQSKRMTAQSVNYGYVLGKTKLADVRYGIGSSKKLDSEGRVQELLVDLGKSTPCLFQECPKQAKMKFLDGVLYEFHFIYRPKPTKKGRFEKNLLDALKAKYERNGAYYDWYGRDDRLESVIVHINQDYWAIVSTFDPANIGGYPSWKQTVWYHLVKVDEHWSAERILYLDRKNKEKLAKQNKEQSEQQELQDAVNAL